MCGGDLVFARLEPDGSAIRAATYLRGSRQDRNTCGMAPDRSGDIVLTGATRSTDLRATSGLHRAQANGPGDIHVSKLAADPSALRWCTYVGGGESPRGGLAPDDRDRVWVVGSTTSPDFRTTAGAFQRQAGGTRDAVVFALASEGSAPVAWAGPAGTRRWAWSYPSDNVHVAGHTEWADFPVRGDAAQRTPGGRSDTYSAGLTADLGTVSYATCLGDAWTGSRSIGCRGCPTTRSCTRA